MEVGMEGNLGVIFWLFLLTVPVIAMFLIAPGGTTAWRPREADRPLAEARDNRLGPDATMVPGTPDEELYSKLEVRPEMARTEAGARKAKRAATSG
jgi:hypothetical protein